MALIHFLRKSGLGISKSLIAIFIILAIATFSFSQITQPDFLQPILKETIVQQLDGGQLDEAYTGLLRDCQNRQTMNFPLEQFSKTLTINCTELKSGGRGGFADLFAGAATDSLFGDSYNANVCNGVECIRKFQSTDDPIQKIGYLMNANFNKFVGNLSEYFIIGAIICALLILLLAEGLPAKLMGLGFPLASSGLPYLFMGAAKDKLATMLPARALLAVEGLINSLSGAFFYMLISGVVLIFAGIIAKFVIKKKAKDLSAKK